MPKAHTAGSGVLVIEPQSTSIPKVGQSLSADVNDREDEADDEHTH